MEGNSNSEIINIIHKAIENEMNEDNQVEECASDTAEQKEEQEAPAAEAPKQAKKKTKAKKPQKAEAPKEKKKTVGKSGMELADYIEANRAEVMALYTNGPFSLKQLAVEYSCDNKELHEILARKGLLKPQA